MSEKETDDMTEPGSYKNAKGLFPWKPGDEPAEDTLRRLRDKYDVVTGEKEDIMYYKPETIFGFRINSYEDRTKVVHSLVEAGYGVRVIERVKNVPYKNEIDYFVCIISVPKLPIYKED